MSTLPVGSCYGIHPGGTFGRSSVSAPAGAPEIRAALERIASGDKRVGYAQLVAALPPDAVSDRQAPGTIGLTARSAAVMQAEAGEVDVALDTLRRNYDIPGGDEYGRVFPLSVSKVNSPYGMRQRKGQSEPKMHNGIDLHGKIGDPVYAVADGVVRTAGWTDVNGNYIILDHDGGDGMKHTAYVHLDKMHVKKGDRVREGQRIGDVGTTGRSTGPHLHFMVYAEGFNAVDPWPYIKGLPIVGGGRSGGGGRSAGGAQPQRPAPVARYRPSEVAPRRAEPSGGAAGAVIGISAALGALWWLSSRR